MGKLTDMLQAMMDETMRTGGRVKRKLGNNLHVAITGEMNHYIVEISRDNVFPSASEWNTLIKHFPYFTKNQEPVQFLDRDKRMGMQAKIPKRHMVQHRF
jgi:hypothetical protein